MSLDPAGVTAQNWQDPPFNRWAFWHARDILPTQRVPHGLGMSPLPESLADVSNIQLTRASGSPGTVAEVLADTYTDAYLVLQDGTLVTEWYGPLGAPDLSHALMSVSTRIVPSRMKLPNFG